MSNWKADTIARIQVMQAALDGEQLQARVKKSTTGGELTESDMKWIDWDNPHWDWDHMDYRIKPEGPREYWLTRYNTVVDASNTDYEPRVEDVLLREVTDD